MELHPATLYAVSVLVMLIAAGAALLTWYRHRDTAGLRGWSAGLLLIGGAIWMLGNRDPETPFVAVAAANFLFVAGFALQWMSLRRFNDHDISPAVVAMTTVAISAGFLALVTFIDQLALGLRMRSIVLSLFVGGLAFGAAREAWRGRQSRRLQSRHVIALAMIGIVVGRLVRLAMIGLQTAGLLMPGVVETAQGLVLYFTTVCILVATFGLVMMANERHHLLETDGEMPEALPRGGPGRTA